MKCCTDEDDDDGLHQGGRGGESKRAILWMYQYNNQSLNKMTERTVCDRKRKIKVTLKILL